MTWKERFDRLCEATGMTRKEAARFWGYSGTASLAMVLSKGLSPQMKAAIQMAEFTSGWKTDLPLEPEDEPVPDPAKINA